MNTIPQSQQINMIKKNKVSKLCNFSCKFLAFIISAVNNQLTVLFCSMRHNGHLSCVSCRPFISLPVLNVYKMTSSTTL